MWQINLIFVTIVLAKGVLLISNSFPKYVKLAGYVLVSMHFKIVIIVFKITPIFSSIDACLISLKTNKRSAETGTIHSLAKAMQPSSPFRFVMPAYCVQAPRMFGSRAFGCIHN